MSRILTVFAAMALSLATHAAVRPSLVRSYTVADGLPQDQVLRMVFDADGFLWIATTAAAILKVSTPTVAFHVRRIYEKLQVHSKSEAVAKAIRGDVFR